MRPNGSPKLLEERRKKAIELLGQNLRPVEVAKLLGVDRRSVRRWKSAYTQKGIAALKSRPASGRTPKLNDALKLKISKILEKGPAKFGFKQKGWTYSLIAKVIKNQFGVVYHRNYIGPLLRSMGWTVERLKTAGQTTRQHRVKLSA